MISTFIESGAVPTEKALINEQWISGGIVVKDRELISYGESAGKSGLAIPGFVDLQVNGHGGMDLLSAKTVSDIKQVSKSLYSQGVVGYLPTLITGPKSETLRVMALIENAKREAESDEAKILGIHRSGIHRKSREFAKDLLNVEKVQEQQQNLVIFYRTPPYVFQR